MRVLQQKPGLGSLALGWEKGDRILSQIGRQWLAAHGPSSGVSKDFASQGPDVFVATELYRVGGHTALIGDFVRALAEIMPTAVLPHLIVTNGHGGHTSPLGPEIITRTGIDADKIEILPGPELVDRLDQLFARVAQLRPRRLFLFHHPDDPVACAVAQPDIVAETFMVHHADSLPSFGLYLPGVRVIDVTPGAAALTRAQGLNYALLLLTAPDPGPRPVGFLQRGKLFTATCGTYHKFRSDYRYPYAQTVAIILRATRGAHVHIGPLADSQLSDIRDAIRAKHLEVERFIHVPWTSSLAATLWEHECDLYFASFPVGGARTNVEVMASATPHLRHSVRPVEFLVHDELQAQGGLVWRSWEELEEALASAADNQSLKEKSKLMRAAYDKLHHPRVFAASLKSILEGRSGFHDPQEKQREHNAVNRMLACFESRAGNTAASHPEFSIARLQETINQAIES